MPREELTDEYWSIEDSADNLARYQDDGQDLSPTIHQGQRLADLRGLCELSLDELAAKSGVEKKELMAMEAGLQVVQPAQAASLSAAMEVDYADLWIDTNQY